LSAATGNNQFRYRRIAHLLQAGENLFPINKHSQLTLFGTTFSFNHNIIKILFKFSGKTCRQLLLPSGCTVLNQNLHGFSSPAGFD
jgi:hypothetical protein